MILKYWNIPVSIQIIYILNFAGNVDILKKETYNNLLLLGERNTNAATGFASYNRFSLGKDTFYFSLVWILFCFILILICFQVHGMISTVAVLSYSSVKGLITLFVQLLLPLHHHQRGDVQKTGSSLITRCSMKYIVFLKEQYKKNLWISFSIVAGFLVITNLVEQKYFSLIEILCLRSTGCCLPFPSLSPEERSQMQCLPFHGALSS